MTDHRARRCRKCYERNLEVTSTTPVKCPRCAELERQRRLTELMRRQAKMFQRVLDLDLKGRT